jgi:ribosomal protein S18 acetylase RimI-like enzyme
MKSPSLLPLSMLHLRYTTAEDIPLIASLAHKIWNAHYPPIIGQAQVDYMLDLMYSRDALEKQMGEGQRFFVVEDEDGAIGFVSISDKGNGDYFLHKFYVDTDRHRSGIGTEVMEALFSPIGGLRSITLTVNRQNYKAINFYFKNGFTIDHIANFDIGKGYVMEDFVMKKRVVK